MTFCAQTRSCIISYRKERKQLKYVYKDAYAMHLFAWMLTNNKYYRFHSWTCRRTTLVSCTSYGHCIRISFSCNDLYMKSCSCRTRGNEYSVLFVSNNIKGQHHSRYVLHESWIWFSSRSYSNIRVDIVRTFHRENGLPFCEIEMTVILLPLTTKTPKKCPSREYFLPKLLLSKLLLWTKSRIDV